MQLPLRIIDCVAVAVLV